ncbi:ExbD/TolR family protein [Rubrimonas cliftonensis]|uniref:Biopolymer transport protein ExbD n=1 Tax=Rubrimonas cliftonensis TaxID=89524 RepID=A0A1H4DNX9_9RHOB|nr:biopolymer transporter ExbD [Rubrimonas cliftonensis]SEA73912.1 biopolymer transport protein ExbD [Rubrimonas cliftonensis]
MAEAAALPPQRRRRARPRGPGLTALIDVVFILLIFFMLAAKLGVERALTIDASGEVAGGMGVEGALLLEVTPQGGRLSGAAMAPEALRAALAARLAADPAARVLVSPRDGADAAQVVAALDLLAGLGARGAALLPPGR